MARKKTETAETTAEASEVADKPVRLLLSPDMHRLLRLVAAHDGESMSSYTRDVIEKHILGEAKKRGIKP